MKTKPKITEDAHICEGMGGYLWPRGSSVFLCPWSFSFLVYSFRTDRGFFIPQKGGEKMDKEELKKLLDDLPDEDYLDKLIEALNLWSRVKDELPDEEYVENVCHAAQPGTFVSIEMLPDEDYLANVVIAASPATALALDELPDEDYLDKVIQAGKVSFED